MSDETIKPVTVDRDKIAQTVRSAYESDLTAKPEAEEFYLQSLEPGVKKWVPVFRIKPSDSKKLEYPS